jgi:hypothetical protein
MKKLLTYMVFVLCFSFSVSASDFKCKVLDSVKLEESGRLSSSSKIAKQELGKEFTVNRLTGVMSGSGFVNNMSGTKPNVYNYIKSEGNSYSVITIYKPNYTVDHLTINEWVESAKKPFFYMGAWGEKISGICEYF